MRKNDINFIEVYKAQGKEKIESNTPAKIYLAIVLAVALLLGSFSVKLLLDQRVLNSEIDSLQSYVNDTNRQKKLTEIKKMQSDIANIEKMEGELSNLNTVMETIPRFDRSILNVIGLNKPSDAKIQNIYYNGEWVEIELTTTSVVSMSNYSLELERSNIFEDVYYNGYTAEDGVYRGSIFVALKGYEVKGDE